VAEISSDRIVLCEKKEKLVRILYLFLGGNEKAGSDYFGLGLGYAFSFLTLSQRF
jgi:hypothetical protein